MKNILSLDSPIVRFMEHVADFFILNILTVICCIPLITAGAAFTAHFRMMQNLVLDEEQQIVKAYFHTFKENFKQATVVWLVTMLLIAVYAVDIFVIYVYFDEAWAQITYFILAVLGVVTFGVVIYATALIARYENTLKEHLRNSFILAIANLPRTVLLIVLAAVPLLLAIVSIELFMNTMIIWFTFGISVILFSQALVLKPIILRLEQTNTDSEEDES